MVNDDYLLDDLERTQLSTTRRRRWNRSRRYYQLLVLAVGFVALLILAAPSLISHTGIAKSMLASSAKEYGWTASAESIDVGWITPLSIRGLKLVGSSGETVIQIDRADTALAVTNLIDFDPGAIGEVSLRGVALECAVGEGHSSIESDLAKLLEPSEETGASVRAIIQIQDVSATITDKTSGAAWGLSQSNLDVAVDGQRVEGNIAGVVNEPSGSGGAIQSRFDWRFPSAVDSLASVAGSDSGKLWELSIDTESFPLSVTNLILRRFASSADGLPQQLSGDTSGRLTLVGSAGGAVRASLGDLRVRNLVAIRLPIADGSMSNAANAKPGLRQWANELATLDGEVAIAEGWLLGQGLEITTDFASAMIDGSFPTTISLVGSEDNPLSWLQALDGKAQVDVDLASLDRALPGLIPLRQNVTIVSGRARGMIENTPESQTATSGGATTAGARRRSQLTLSSDSLRARADGRIVMIDPIELTATVTDENGSLRAERFDATSSFIQASGSGTLESGMAEVQIDFGRLYTMLRPVIDLSDLSLGGAAGGKLNWTVQRSPAGGVDQWDLQGTGQAENLLVTLPSGHRFKRNIVQGDVTAKGQWNGRSLQQLSFADVGIRSGGVVLRAELMSPVSKPSADSQYLVRLETDGRLENLSESLRPWLPTTLGSAEGRLTGSAIAKISRAGGSLSKADFVVTQPRLNYANRWYSQPKVTVKFDGILDWPSGNLAAQELTLQGDALTFAVRGEASREKTNLDIAFNSDLKRLQGSIGSTIARAASTDMIHPISFRAVQNSEYRVSGLCKGNLNLSGGPDQWRIESSTSMTDLAFYSPADHRIVPPGTPAGGIGPMPNAANGSATFGQGFGRTGQNEFGDLIWQEPRLKIDATAAFDSQAGEVRLPELQIASDGFAGTLAGSVQMQGDKVSAQLSGLAKWKMDVVAARLSALLGTAITATGIHESPVAFEFSSSDSQSMAFGFNGELGWDQCEIAGIRLGRARLPFEMSERTLRLSQTSVPILSITPASRNETVRAGQASFAAQIDYASSPVTIRLDQGASVDSLVITPSTAAGWLKYLTPLAASATSLDGSVAAKFDEALIVIDDPSASVVRGSLEVQNMRLASGPIANQLIQGVEQIKSIARLAGGVAEPASAKTLIEMPPQSVDFSFENGVATHQRMFFKIDRANVMTSGRVGIDSSINLVAHVPLDARWLGSDLKGLAGQTLTFPITGTFARPKLDDSVVRSLMTELGTKAGTEVIQNRLDGLIQKQFGSSMEQLNSGLEKIFSF